MQCIIFLLEMSLHCSSLLIGYANFTLHQLRLILIFVSQYFAVSSQEFTEPFSVHDERHFAEEGDDSPLNIRYNGSESSESYVRYNGSIKKTAEVRHYGHAFLIYESNVQHTLLTDYVDMSTNPTFVILDSGCTRAMGSRFANDRLVKACMNHRYSHLVKFTKEASNNRFSFVKRYALSVATSNHPILDVMFLARCGQKPEHSFASTTKITCPACNGRHRAHTYDEHCNLERPKEGTVRRKGVPTRKVKDDEEEVNKPESDSVKPKQRLGPKKTPTQRQSEHKPVPVEPERSIAEEPPLVETSSGPKQQVIVEDDEVLPLRQKKDPKIKADLPLALKRIHEKLDSPVELYKLHLKHYHMSTEQFRKRTSALKIPEDIYAKYDLIVKQCDTCQKEKKGPSRSKISGMRSEVFGDLTFVDHAEIPLDSKYKLMFLIIYDGATQLMTSFPCETKSDGETIDLLLDYFDLYQLSPKYIVGDQGFSGTELEAFYNRKGIRFIALGPQTPWPNRAEAAVHLFKQQVRLTLDGVRADPKCNPFTFGMLLRMASLTRNSMVTFGGVTPLEMAFGRRPQDIIGVDNADPARLTAEVPRSEVSIEATRKIAMKAYLEARQSEDLRRDIASRLQFTDGPFFPGDKIFYWNPNASKIKPHGGRSSSWIQGKVISQDGSMITIDLGTRVLKVNSSKIRKDHQPIDDVDIPLEPVAMQVADKTASARAADKTASACHADTTASNGCNSRKETDPASKLLHADALLSGPEGVAYGTYNWNQ